MLVTSHVVAEGYSFAWDFRPYLRKAHCEEQGIPFKSKNDLAIDMIETFPANGEEQVYVLMDSWYTGKKVVDACNAKGFYVIGAEKSNRKICPLGVRLPMSEFAGSYLENDDLHSVIVKGSNRFQVYAYEGPVFGVENAKVLLSWEDSFRQDKKPFCILSTDTFLDVVTILEYYQIRWEIETGYGYFKELLGFDQYQMLSFKAIERYWAIQYLVQNYLEHQRNEWSKGSPITLGDTVRRIRSEMLGQLAVYAYREGLATTPLKKVLEALKLTV